MSDHLYVQLFYNWAMWVFFFMKFQGRVGWLRIIKGIIFMVLNTCWCERCRKLGNLEEWVLLFRVVALNKLGIKCADCLTIWLSPSEDYTEYTFEVSVGSSIEKVSAPHLTVGNLYMEEVYVKLGEELWFTVGCQHIPFVASPPDVWTE